MTRAAVLGLAALLATAGMASAQTFTPAYRVRRVTFAAGTTTQSGYKIGDITAELRRNAVGTTPPLPLFRAESEIGRAAAADIRLALALTRVVAIEIAGVFAQPQLNVRLSADAEANEPALAGERVSHYAVDVSGIVLLPDIGLGRRARGYAIGGGGYVRQLHEGRLRIDTGRTIHAGGGVQYWFRGAVDRRQRPLGLRGEARLVHRTGGIDYEGRSRTFPAVSALLFLGF